MKIGEILELTQTIKLADIAKEFLDFGEKKASEALKKAGCYSISGKRGWYFDGDKSILEQSVYSFVPATRRKTGTVVSAEKEVAATLEKPEAINNPSSQLSNNTDSKQVNKQSNNPTSKTVMKPTFKKVTYEIEEQLHDQLRIKAILEKRSVSELANELIKRGIEGRY